jgi:anti-sigma factor RsiW
MTASSFHSQISDDLLSAYLDDTVSTSERTLVENALHSDPDVAWRLETLRQTVQLLHTLRQVELPTSFSAEAILAKVQVDAQAARQPGAPRILQPEPQPSVWQRVLDFWRSGSPVLRNAAVGAFVLFLVFGLGSQLMLDSAQPSTPFMQNARVQLPASATQNERDLVAPASADIGAASGQDASGAAALALTTEPAAESAMAPSGGIAAKDAPANEASTSVQAETDDADDALTTSAGPDAVATLVLIDRLETDSNASESSTPLEQVSGGLPSQARSGAGGREDATGLDAAMMESASAEAAPMPVAPAVQVSGELALPTSTPSPPPTFASTPTVAPSATPLSPPTTTPAAAAIAQPAGAVNARIDPSVSAPSPASQPTSSPSWLWLIQWAAALAAVGFLALWLRSRRSPS